eukprot:jgi/Bigna1/71259/fgenesh1_pg.15_\
MGAASEEPVSTQLSVLLPARPSPSPTSNSSLCYAHEVASSFLSRNNSISSRSEIIAVVRAVVKLSTIGDSQGGGRDSLPVSRNCTTGDGRVVTERESGRAAIADAARALRSTLESSPTTTLSSADAESAAMAVASVAAALREEEDGCSTITEENAAAAFVEAAGTIRALVVGARPSFSDGSTTSEGIGSALAGLATAAKTCAQIERVGRLSGRYLETVARSLVVGQNVGTLSYGHEGEDGNWVAGMRKLRAEEGGVAKWASGRIVGVSSISVPSGVFSGADIDISLLKINSSQLHRCRRVPTTADTDFAVKPFSVFISRDGVEQTVERLREPLEFRLRPSPPISPPKVSPAGGRSISACSGILGREDGPRRGVRLRETQKTPKLTSSAYVSKQWRRRRVTAKTKSSTKKKNRGGGRGGTHLSEFALLAAEDPMESGDGPAPPYASGLFYFLASLYSLTATSLLAQLCYLMRGVRLKKEVAAKVQLVWLLLLCACRVTLCLRYSQGIPWFNQMPQSALAAVAALPYAMLCWTFALTALQWAAVFNVSMKSLRRLRFSDYSSWYIGGCSAASVSEVALFFAVMGGYGALSSDVVDGFVITGSVIIAVVALLIAGGVTIYGVAVGRQFTRMTTSAHKRAGRRMIICALTIGICFFLDSVLWVSSIAIMASSASWLTAQALVAASYLLNLICTLTRGGEGGIGVLSWQFQVTINKIRAQIERDRRPRHNRDGTHC